MRAGERLLGGFTQPHRVDRVLQARVNALHAAVAERGIGASTWVTLADQEQVLRRAQQIEEWLLRPEGGES